MKTLIVLEDIHKSYLTNSVLKGISFSVMQGDFHILLGQNGAGKSTVLRLIAGLERVDQGSGRVFGAPLLVSEGERKKRVGYVAETVEYQSPLSMDKFFKFYKRYFPKWNEELFQTIVHEKGMDLSKKFAKYSRGQKMQLNLLAELSKSPDILLVDEITSVLDLYSRNYFLEKLDDFRRMGGTVLLTTNIIGEVQSYATDVVILKDGKVRLSAPLNNIPDDLLRLRRVKGNNHPVFSEKNCFWAGKNKDDTSTYVIHKSIAQKFQIPEDMIIPGKALMEEIFAYHLNQVEEHDSSEKKDVKQSQGDYAESA